MRIYAVADLHGKPARIEKIRQVLLASAPDALVVAGDITNYFNPVNVIEQLNRMPVPVLAVRGNTDPTKVDRLLERYPNTSSLHLRERKINDLKFTGVSGTIPLPFNSRIRLREKKIFDALGELVTEDSVLVVHPPPRGIQDEVFGKFHAGCRRLLQFIVNRQPRVVVCGHIHERPGVASVGRTTIVNCCVAGIGRGAMIHFDKNGSVKVEMLQE